VVVTQALIVGNDIVTDIITLNVRKSQGENSSVGSFMATIDNRNGVNSSKFNVGEEVKIYSDTTNVLEGVFDYTFDFTFADPQIIGIFLLEEISFSGEGQTETVTLRGRDFTSKLQDITIEPVVYNNTEVSAIVDDIMANEVPSISTNNVTVTTTTLNRKRYNHTNVYDAIRELAELSDYYFYVDNQKDLNFKLKNTVSSGYTLDSTNVTQATFESSEQDMVNSVWVYGDRQLFSAPQDSFTGDGVGSVFTLTYKPSDTIVKVSGAIQKGAVLEMMKVPTSGQQYLIDYDQRQLIFTSGTEAGYNIPGSLVNITADYWRSTPIVKRGEDDASIEAHGIKEKIIIDKSIKDPLTARDIVKKTLALKSDPLAQGTLKIQGLVFLNPGDTILVNLPYHNINNQTYTILETTYDFNPVNNLSEQVLTVKVANKINTMVDTIKQIMLDLRKLQADDADETDVITRLKQGTGSFGFRVKEWTVSTRSVGSSFILSHPVLGDLGSNVGTLQNYLGDSRTALSVVVSGGEV